jgi:uncharacterized membrane protein YqaE (UPF0057 family)
MVSNDDVGGCVCFSVLVAFALGLTLTPVILSALHLDECELAGAYSLGVGSCSVAAIVLALVGLVFKEGSGRQTIFYVCLTLFIFVLAILHCVTSTLVLYGDNDCPNDVTNALAGLNITIALVEFLAVVIVTVLSCLGYILGNSFR